MNNPDNNKLYNAIISSLGGKVDKNSVEKAKKGDLTDILKALPEDDAQKLKQTLNDKEKTRQLLSSDAAKSILKMLMDGKKNG